MQTMVLQGDTAAPLIILVEDDVSVREALSFALRIEGFRVQVFSAAEPLLANLLADEIACLVCDHHLPGMSGMDALSRARESGLRCPAILITTQPKPDVRATAQQFGARILEKPLLGGELPAVIREMLTQAPDHP